MQRRIAARVGLLMMGGLLGGCAASSGVVAPGDMTLSTQNGTTKPLVLVVNGAPVKDVGPGASVEVTADALPSLPWKAEVRLLTGRSLLSLTIRAGDVIEGQETLTGDAARIDLSCGRIDLWSGPPLLGPAPQPGTPGDCDP
jgi:hypothetical protein